MQLRCPSRELSKHTEWETGLSLFFTVFVLNLDLTFGRLWPFWHSSCLDLCPPSRWTHRDSTGRRFPPASPHHGGPGLRHTSPSNHSVTQRQLPQLHPDLKLVAELPLRLGWFCWPEAMNAVVAQQTTAPSQKTSRYRLSKGRPRLPVTRLR